MALLCDTRLIPAQLRVAAVNTAIAATEVPMRFVAASTEDVRLRIDCWTADKGSHALRLQGSASCLSRSDRQTRIPSPRRIAVALALQSDGVLTIEGTDIVTAPGQLRVIDQTRPFALRWYGDGGFHLFVVDYERIGLPAALIHAAIPRLGHGVLHDLVRAHLTRLIEVDAQAMGLAHSMAGAATTELLRALILSAINDSGSGRQSVRDIRHEQIKMHIERHLQDASLRAGTIADAHHMSVRQLYKIWTSYEQVPLSAWIIAARLEGARRDLSQPRPTAMTISAIARRWGFANQTHFSRRFRSAFGVTPRQWSSASS